VANFRSIAAAGASLERLLNRCFEQAEPVADRTTRAVLVRTEDLRNVGAGQVVNPPAVSLFLYRVTSDGTTRAAWSAVGHQDDSAHLPLDLHFLLTAWADNAQDEYAVLGRAMACLEARPILSGPLLLAEGGWATNEALQVCLEDLTLEDTLRTFDALPSDFKTSVPYVARVVRIHEPTLEATPAATTVVTGLMPEAEAP
jgi:hypothetical protein